MLTMPPLRLERLTAAGKTLNSNSSSTSGQRRISPHTRMAQAMRLCGAENVGMAFSGTVNFTFPQRISCGFAVSMSPTVANTSALWPCRQLS
jgi:hypothetical protein